MTLVAARKKIIEYRKIYDKYIRKFDKQSKVVYTYFKEALGDLEITHVSPDEIVCSVRDSLRRHIKKNIPKGVIFILPEEFK